MKWYRVQLDEVELLHPVEIIDIMIDIVSKPHKYDDKYQQFRQEEFESE